MTEKERALEIYKKFSVWTLHEVNGFEIDEGATIRNCINVVKEIIDSIYDKKCKIKSQEWYNNFEFTSDNAYVNGVMVDYYKNVIKELKKM